MKKLTTTKTVGVAALGNPHCEEPALNKCRGDFNRPHIEGIAQTAVGADSISAQREKGITLVSLVITIVIMLILAGVAISIAVSPNGLFQQAQNATEQWDKAIANESQTMDYIFAQIGLVNWEKAKQEAVAPTSQDEERNNGIIGIGTDGKPVDMDLWLYAIDAKTGGYGLNSKEVLNNEENGGTGTTKITMAGYIGPVSETGEIQGKVPTYIKNAEGEWIPVTSLYKTFQTNVTNNDELVKLTVPPVIPETVENMMAVFINSNITKTPEIPSKVTNMTSTFYGCDKLSSTSIIPSSVEIMDYTFYGCKNLKKTPEILGAVTSMKGAFSSCTNLIEVTNFPDSVVDMNVTFADCSMLQSVKTLPKNLQTLHATFARCTSLKYSPEIPETVINIQTAFQECTSLEKGPEVIPSSVTNMYGTFYKCPKLEGTIEINANIDESIIVYETGGAQYTGSDETFRGSCAEGNGLTILKTSTISRDVINKWTSSNSKIVLEQ